MKNEYAVKMVLN